MSTERQHITTSIAEPEVRSGANQGRIGSLDVRSPEAMELARAWFAAGVRALAKQEAFAARIGVVPSVLSEMLSGRRQRQILLVHALPLLAEVASAQAFIAWQCHEAGFVAPAPKDTVQLSTTEAKLLAFLSRTPVWRLFLGPMIAREFYRVDLDLLEVAIENAMRRPEEPR